VGGAGDRQLTIGHVLALPGKREGLDRLRRRAQERDELVIAGRLDHLPVLDRDRMDEVHRLDDAPAADGYPERVHEPEVTCRNSRR
jgi:hypothetical protein